MEIKINDKITLTEYRISDKTSLVKYLNDPDIYKNTLQIPFPYTEESAEFWLDVVFKKYETNRLFGRLKVERTSVRCCIAQECHFLDRFSP